MKNKIKNRAKKIAVLVLLSMMILSTFVACSSKKPYDTVEKYARAYNALDYNGILDCYDPRVTELFSGVMNLVTNGKYDSGMASIVGDMMGDIMGGYATAYWGDQGVTAKMTTKEISTQMNGDNKATVTAEFTVVWSNGQSEVWEETLSMVKIDGEWYFTQNYSKFGSDLFNALN